MDKTTRLIVVGVLLTGLLVLTYLVLRHFVVPVAWAVILCYVTWPVHHRMKQAFSNRESLAALFTTGLFASLIIVPLVWLTVLLQAEFKELLQLLPQWLEQKPMVPRFISKIPYVGEELQAIFDQFPDLQGLLREHVVPSLHRLGTPLLTILGDVGYVLALLALTLLTMFFLFRDGPHVAGQVKQNLTLVLGERLHAYFATTEATVKAVVYGIVLTAIAQGGLAGLGYWLVGVKAPIVLSLITMLFAMIPFGTPLVWGFTSLWLLLHGEHWAGLSLLLWGALVVSWVDNLIRPLVISGTTKIPFVLVMFGVLGGLTSFGFIGLFLGPVVLGISLAVWREWLQARAHRKPADGA